mgnify:CR=1 FL=1
MRLNKAEQIAIITLALIMSTVITSLVLRSWAAQDQLEKITLERDELMAKLKAAKPENTPKTATVNAVSTAKRNGKRYVFKEGDIVEQTYVFKIKTLSEVQDGDTFRANLNLGLTVGFEPSIRLFTVDCPEHDTPEGQIAKDRTTAWLKDKMSKGDVFVISDQWDKFGGRILGYVVSNGESLANYLLKNKLGRPYMGEGKKPWTKEQIDAILVQKE